MYAYFFGISCSDGVGIQLTMKKLDSVENEKEHDVLDILDLDCEYFPFYNDVHFTIPKAH